MNTSEFLAMQSEYSEKTKGAKDVIDASFRAIEKALNHQLQDFQESQFGFADYGAADGGTSKDIVTKVLARVKERYPKLPVHINYSDLPDNDFNALSALLLNWKGPSQALYNSTEQVTASLSPISFYQRILPEGLVSLGFSATAMHWLNSSPGSIPDHVHIAASSDEEAKRIYRERAHRDLIQILEHRYAEMQKDGYFVLVNFGINEQGEFLGNTRGVHMFNKFYEIAGQMLSEGLITNEELLNMNFPQYYRSKDDYHNALSSDALKGKFELVEIEDLKTVCPYRSRFETTGDRDWFIENYPSTIQTWSYPVFYVGLSDDRPEEERHELVKMLYKRYEADIAAKPEEHGMDYVHHLIVLRRL